MEKVSISVYPYLTVLLWETGWTLEMLREILQVMQREPSSGLNNKSMSKKTPNPNPLLGYLGIFIDQKAKALQQIKLAQSHKLPATFRRP